MRINPRKAQTNPEIVANRNGQLEKEVMASTANLIKNEGSKS